MIPVLILKTNTLNVNVYDLAEEERRGVEKQDRRDLGHEAEADRPEAEEEFFYVQVDDEAAPFDAAAFLAKSGCGTFFQVLVEGSAEHYSFTRDLVIQYRLCDFEEDADVEADSSSSSGQSGGAEELTKLLFPSSRTASGRLNDVRKKLCKAMTPAQPSLSLLLILIRRAGAKPDHEKPGEAPGLFRAQFVHSAFSVQSFRRSLWFLVSRFVESGEAFAEAVKTRQIELALLATYLTSSRWLETEEERRAVWLLPALLQLRVQGLPLWLAHLQDGAASVPRADGTENSEPQSVPNLPQPQRITGPLSREQREELQQRTAAYLWRQIRRVLSPLYMSPDSHRRRPDTLPTTTSSRAGGRFATAPPVYFTDVSTALTYQEGSYHANGYSRSSRADNVFRAKVASHYFGLSFQFAAGAPPRDDETAAEAAAETKVQFGIERFTSSWRGAKLLVKMDLVALPTSSDGSGVNAVFHTFEYAAAHPDRVASGQFATGFFTDEKIQEYRAPSERDGREGNTVLMPWETPWRRAIRRLREQREQELQRRQLESRMRVAVQQVSDEAEAARLLADGNTYFPPPESPEAAGRDPGFDPGLEASRHVLGPGENGPPQNLLAPEQRSYQGLSGAVFLAQPTDPAPTPENILARGAPFLFAATAVYYPNVIGSPINLASALQLPFDREQQRQILFREAAVAPVLASGWLPPPPG
eukprot:g12703.t1